jgi:hypothetical protein
MIPAAEPTVPTTDSSFALFPVASWRVPLVSFSFQYATRPFMRVVTVIWALV